MAVVDMAPISGRIVAEIHRDLAGVDLAPAGETDIDEAREFAAALIGPRIVSSTALKRVHEQTRAGLFVAREEGRLTGVLAFVLLSRAGLEAVWAEAFDACDPASAHMIQAGQEPVALYGWGVAAATKASAVRLIEGANRMGAGAVAGLPYFARPTTEAGHRLMRERMGFVDCPGSTSGLVWLAPSLVEGAAA